MSLFNRHKFEKQINDKKNEELLKQKEEKRIFKKTQMDQKRIGVYKRRVASFVRDVSYFF